MFPRPRIIGFYVEDELAFIDWGWARSRPKAPKELLDDPYMSKKQLLELLAPLEPARWVPHLTSAIWPQPPYDDGKPIGDLHDYWRDTIEVSKGSFLTVIKQERLLFKLKAAIFGVGSHPLHKATFIHADVECRRSDTTRFWAEKLDLSDEYLDKIYSDASQLDKRLFLDIK